MFFLWIFLGLIIIIVLINAVLLISTLKIEIQNFHYMLPKNKSLNKDFKIVLRLYLFGKIPIFSTNIDKTKLEKNFTKNNFSRWEKNGANFGVKFFDLIKNLIQIMSIEKINLQVYIGLEDAALTAISVGTVSGLIGFIFGWLKNRKKNEELNFNVIPIYQNINLLKVDFEGIFAIKIRDNIKMIYNLFKKRRVNRNVRTSNRRSYAYSNE